MLRRGREQIQDTRMRSDGRLLRQSWELPSLSRSTSVSTDSRHYLYEAHISITVTGIDHWIWTAYGIVDTYFGSTECVKGYDELGGPFSRVDPLAAGRIDASLPVWDPREYFCKVFEIRTRMILREWNSIVDKIEDAVKE